VATAKPTCKTVDTSAFPDMLGARLRAEADRSK